MDTPPTTAAPSCSKPPRAVTARVRRRAWAEPHVRVWWVGALALFVVAMYFLATRYASWLEGVHLIRSGVPLQGKIVEAGGSTMTGKIERGDTWVRVEYAYNGQTYQPLVMTLEGHKTEEPIIVGTSIPIRVDPAHPDRWTPRLTSPPLVQDLIGGLIVLAAAVLVLLLALWRRSRVLRIWREGEIVQAVVLTARHTALAPRAWAVRCTPVDQEDKRVFNVFVSSGCDVTAGAAAPVLLKSGRAVAYSALNPGS